MSHQPHTYHGSAAALGDGVVLGTLFSHLSSPSEISVLLGAFEEIRKPRALDLLQDEQELMAWFSLPAGPAADARRTAFLSAASSASGNWGKEDDDTMRALWDGFIRVAAYDAYETACDWWTKWRGALGEDKMAIAIPIERHVQVELA